MNELLQHVCDTLQKCVDEIKEYLEKQKVVEEEEEPLKEEEPLNEEEEPQQQVEGFDVNTLSLKYQEAFNASKEEERLHPKQKRGPGRPPEHSFAVLIDLDRESIVQKQTYKGYYGRYILLSNETDNVLENKNEDSKFKTAVMYAWDTLNIKAATPMRVKSNTLLAYEMVEPFKTTQRKEYFMKFKELLNWALNYIE